MAYVPNAWQTGDVITAEKLNHIENGVSNDFVITFTGVTDGYKYCGPCTADKTFQELYDAYSAGKNIKAIAYIQKAPNGGYYILGRISSITNANGVLTKFYFVFNYVTGEELDGDANVVNSITLIECHSNGIYYYHV